MSTSTRKSNIRSWTDGIDLKLMVSVFAHSMGKLCIKQGYAEPKFLLWKRGVVSQVKTASGMFSIPGAPFEMKIDDFLLKARQDHGPIQGICVLLLLLQEVFSVPSVKIDPVALLVLPVLLKKIPGSDFRWDFSVEILANGKGSNSIIVAAIHKERRGVFALQEFSKEGDDISLAKPATGKIVWDEESPIAFQFD